jgi:LysE type translocator
MSTHLLALYVAAVFLAMIAPGPDMMFVLATGIRGRARAGLLATLGVVSSEIVQITAVAAGLSALFAEAPVAFTALRLGGAVTNLANPKSVTFAVALLPQFVDRSLARDEDDRDLLTFNESAIRLREEIAATQAALRPDPPAERRAALDARLAALTGALERNTRQADANPGERGFLDCAPPRRAGAEGEARS